MVRWAERAMLRGFLKRSLHGGALAGNLELGNSRGVRWPMWPHLRWRRLVDCPARASRSVQGLTPLPAPRQVTTGVCGADVRAPEPQRRRREPGHRRWEYRPQLSEAPREAPAVATKVLILSCGRATAGDRGTAGCSGNQTAAGVSQCPLCLARSEAGDDGRLQGRRPGAGARESALPPPRHRVSAKETRGSRNLGLDAA